MPAHTDASGEWPRFDLVTFPEPAGVLRELAAPLLERGVPKAMLGRYHATSELTLLEVPDYGPLVRFGSERSYFAVCLDPRNGAVVEISTYVPDKAINPAAKSIHGPPLFINSSLDQFIASVRAVIARFPFDSEGTTREGEEDDELNRLDAEWNQAADDLESVLGAIDPPVLDADAFWTTFFWDVRIGDFMTDMVLEYLAHPDE